MLSLPRFIILVVASLVPASASANPLKAPKRMVNGQTVDLSPLFQWWAKKNGDRPLSGWLHVMGEIVGTNAAGWVVTAQLDEKDAAENGKKILLRNPPLEDRAEFEKLLSRKKALEGQDAKLKAEAAQASTRLKDIAQEQKVARDHHLRPPRYPEANTLQQEQKNAKNHSKTIETEISELNKQLKSYPSGDHYTVDCFALRAPEQVDGLPVFEHGVGLK